jgi:hypothetical protein
MVVRLQTAEGKIKEYRTVYGEGSNYGEPASPEKYVTKCGQEWRSDPGPQEECYHLECAIYLVERQKRTGYGIFKFSLIFAIGFMVFMRQDLGFVLMFSGLSTLMAFAFLINGLMAGKRFDELTEYRDKRTINGIRAWQIFAE